MSKGTFYICEICGNLVELVENGGGKLVCCGSKMTKLEAGAVEASREKHIPVVEIADGIIKVSVGSVIHPMSEEHSIGWISLETDAGSRRKNLKPGDAPVAEFALLPEEKVIAVYAWCNLHGLWKAEI